MGDDFELAAAVERIKALPAFAIDQWWLTFYIAGAPDHLTSVALQLRRIGAQNTDGSDGGFLYPKLPVASEVHPVEEAISTVMRILELADVELIGVDVDTSQDLTTTNFKKLIGF
jgi:hypothetical protein